MCFREKFCTFVSNLLGMDRERPNKVIGWIPVLVLLLMQVACTPPHKQEVDVYNDRAYNLHYRNIDSVRYYAQKAMKLSEKYRTGKAEALNNLAFVDLMRMHYSQAYAKLDSVSKCTDDQVELLVADIQLMRLCQRESHNKEFYDYHEQALKRMRRINEDEKFLSQRQKRRMVYARSEFYLVTSTYYYYVGLEQPSVMAIRKINQDGEIQTDMGQFLAYLYNVGAGGIITEGSQEEINQQEFDYLMRCYMLARQHNYPFWEANSLQSLSEHLLIKRNRDKLLQDNLPAMKFINLDYMPDSLLAGNLAQRSLEIFKKYGDVYQTAGSYRTLASCYWQIKDYPSAIICLQNALGRNSYINQAPDLVASIREQLSVVYSSVNDKQGSDYNRNIYLDLQEQTRQDRYLESRAGQLERTSQQLNLMIGAVGFSILVILGLLVLFHYLRRRNHKQDALGSLLVPLEQWRQYNERYMEQLEDKYEEVSEQLAVSKLHLVDNKKKNLEQRTKVSLANNVMPLIDRMLHEIDKLKQGNEEEGIREERYTYIRELTDKINELNTTLTEWIQLRQGSLSLHIESFPLQQVFDIVRKGRMGFQLKGISLEVEETATVVKADRVLTLFMVNTLSDNARKFTETGGKVTIRAAEGADYVEVSVSDTGVGLTAEQAEHIFDRKIIRDQDGSNSHGFGLANCNGIINKYHKISQIFSVCKIGVESVVGKGSRFYFRLPKGVSRFILLFFMLSAFSLKGWTGAVHANGKSIAIAKNDYMALAGIYADSAYFSNVNGNYRQTLFYADTCRYYLNKYYKQLRPSGNLLMEKMASQTSMPAEIKWFHDSIPMNYNIILDIRNESAVAALALHEWDLYRYNNSVYTHLFKEKSADNTLGEYCRMMMKSETNKNVAIALLILFLLSIFPVYYVMYYRHRLFYQFCIERVKHINTVLLSDVRVEQKLANVEVIASDRFPDRLKNIIVQIQGALATSVEKSRKSQANIELLEDEARCVEYENEKLHVSNSILDNCLSTLKHETMYYPSRIRQLVEDDGTHLSAIDELANYYKELYSILSQQVMSQVETIKLVSKPLSVKDFIDGCRIDGSTVGFPSVIGEPDQLRFLFDILYSKNKNQPLRLSAEERKGGYVVFHVLLNTLSLSDEECRNLFSLADKDLLFCICRQIARENGEATNRRGCGVTASKVEGGTMVHVILPKAAD